jgi:hypothetical protein
MANTSIESQMLDSSQSPRSPSLETQTPTPAPEPTRAPGTRISWPEAHTRVILQGLLQETRDGNHRAGLAFKIAHFKDIRLHHLDHLILYSPKQCQSKWLSLKADWGEWLRHLNATSGWGRDPEDGRPVAEPTVMDEYFNQAANGKRRKFRHRTMPFQTELQELLAGREAEADTMEINGNPAREVSPEESGQSAAIEQNRQRRHRQGANARAPRTAREAEQRFRDKVVEVNERFARAIDSMAESVGNSTASPLERVTRHIRVAFPTMSGTLQLRLLRKIQQDGDVDVVAAIGPQLLRDFLFEEGYNLDHHISEFLEGLESENDANEEEEVDEDDDEEVDEEVDGDDDEEIDEEDDEEVDEEVDEGEVDMLLL